MHVYLAGVVRVAAIVLPPADRAADDVESDEDVGDDRTIPRTAAEEADSVAGSGETRSEGTAFGWPPAIAALRVRPK